MKKITTQEIAVSAALAALSATVQLIHLGYLSPQWGMWIDVVSVSWVIAYFLFGIKPAVLVSAVGAIIITLFAPETWLGASMKLVATLPILLALFAWVAMQKKNHTTYAHWQNLIIPLLIGTLVRCLTVLPLNYFYAIPIWTGMGPAQAMKVIPWFVIAGFNVVQSIIDVGLAWVIVYRFKLSRFATSDIETKETARTLPEA